MHVDFAPPPINDADVEAVTAALRSGWITTGPISIALEGDLRTYLQRPHVLAVSSCTAALECALASLRLPPGSRVAVPSWTFVSTVTTVVRQGHTPVMIDADPATLNLSVASLRRAVDRGVDAVIPVHFAGNPVDTEVFTLCEDAELPVIEDCAHAFGTTLPRSPASIAQCYSFYATKNLTSAEGGAVATDDDEVAAFVASYRLHGLSKDAWRRYAPGGSPHYDVLYPGIKANLPDVLAALARSQLQRFDEHQAARRAMVVLYRRLLAGFPVRTIPAQLDEAGADHLLVIRLPDGVDRAALVEKLQQRSISTSVHFRPVHTFDGLRRHLDCEGSLVNCDTLADRVLSLPLHPLLTEEDVTYVVGSLADALRELGAGGV